MFRKLAGIAALGLVICATAAFAADVKGKVTKVDESNNKITLSVDGKDTEYAVAKDCKWPKVKDKKSGSDKDLDLKGLSKMVDRAKEKSGSVEITATVEKKDGKDAVTAIKMESGGKKKDKDKDKDKDKNNGQ
jgi:hypothetical protein